MENRKDKSKAGAKSRYNKNFHPLLAELLARLGFTDKEAAEKLGICEKTYTNWKKKYKELLPSIKKGKDDIINKIEHALYQRALGYEYQEIDIEYEDVLIDDEVKKIKKVKEKQKQMAADVTAIIFSLKNLVPNKWRDRRQVEMSGNVGITMAEIHAAAEELEGEEE